MEFKGKRSKSRKGGKKTKQKGLQSRSNEARFLLKKCFEEQIFSLVPFEIWSEIVFFADTKTMFLLYQTCWSFKELVDNVCEKNFSLAIRFRAEGHITPALKYLQRCADHGNSLAMCHLGFAYREGGWGLKAATKKSTAWFKKSAKSGSDLGMAFYAFCLSFVSRDKNESIDVWAKKALSARNPFVIGYCYHFGLGVSQNIDMAAKYFEVSAKEGNEFGQYMLGDCYEDGFGVEEDYAKAFYWYQKSAEQGFATSQFLLGSLYADGRGCKQDERMGFIWNEKAASQNHLLALKTMKMCN